MTKTDRASKPLLRRNVSRSVKARCALRDNLALVSNCFFVSGAEDPPKGETKVIPVECVINDQKTLHYEVRAELANFKSIFCAYERQGTYAL